MPAVIIFWIFTLFVGASAFAFAYIFLQLGTWYSLGYALVVMLVCRGILSMIRRSLILRERMSPESDSLTRTVETNRAIFWRRALFLAAIPILYFAGAYYLAGLAPQDALDALPQAIVAGLTNLLYVLFLLAANFALFLGPFYIYTRIGKTMINPDDANFGVNMDDVRGQRGAVIEMRRILRLIEHGRLYVKAGGKRERGVLMVGPPGTGKTMLAKAIASTLHVPIYIAAGGSFAGMFLGIDALSVYLMVRAARKKAKVWGGCIVFIDEIDALGQKRSGTGGAGPMMGGMGGMFGGGQLGLNMLLVLMDGIDNPGLYFDKKQQDATLDTPDRREEFARITDGYSPADIEQVLSLALLYAFEDGRDSLYWKDIREAMGNVEAGLAIPVEYTERDKIAVARHELGHAIASHFFQKDHSHVRLSIRRRANPQIGEIGGYHKSLPMEEEWLEFRSQLAADIRASLGSLACEHVFYGENTTGVTMDLTQATGTASR